MTVIDVTGAAEIIGVRESWIRDRVKPGTPKAKQIPHFRLPGSRMVRFHKEIVQAWADAGCPPWDTWTPPENACNLTAKGVSINSDGQINKRRA